MKKFLVLLLGIALVYSCSTSTDENGNSTTTVVPIGPSNLTGSVASTTQINLSWTDNSTNESGFKIERKTGTGMYAVVGTTVTDVTSFSDTGLTPNTTYIYRVYSNNAVGNSLTYSNELNLTTLSAINLPSLTTISISLITTTTAVSGGTITSDGGANITARGVAWSTSPNPTIALTTRTNDGSGTGTFTTNLTGLLANTTYYLRAYATNSVGTAYGNEVSFTTLNISGPNVTDIDGNIYQSVIICNQTWTKTNLNASKYRDGTLIPQVTDFTQWANLTTGAWCYYANNTANGTIYGKLYNWYAVMGIYDAASLNNPSLRKQLAPQGWHIPSQTEWDTLRFCLGGQAAGGPMKETGTTHWISPNAGATNISGFTALPGGYRYDGTNTVNGYLDISTNGYWWYDNLGSSGNRGGFGMEYLSASCYPAGLGLNSGMSVRCVKD
jgi:uncharacterized protein (TIGR02145 family)